MGGGRKDEKGRQNRVKISDSHITGRVWGPPPCVRCNTVSNEWQVLLIPHLCGSGFRSGPWFL